MRLVIRYIGLIKSLQINRLLLFLAIYMKQQIILLILGGCMSNFLLLNKVEENEITNYMPTERKLKDVASFFQNFSDPTRLKIISALSINDLCVNDLSLILDANQTTISHQLKFLKNQYIVVAKREGKIIKYSLQNKFINDLMNYAIESLKDNTF
ncbi:MAG: winged helix-turn-helix transcriptional regulator [Clostridiales bacterium]|nr:winged helix-turn-helix transcriptional regulator [Clostridiales bacterium]